MKVLKDVDFPERLILNDKPELLEKYVNYKQGEKENETI